jgi:hypothetical protein
VMNETHQPGTLAPLVPVPARPQKSRKGLWIGLGIGLVFLCCAAAAMTALLGRNQIPAMARLFATRTARPTSTPLPTNTPIPTLTLTRTVTPLASPTNTLLPATATSRAFVITDQAFSASYKGDCNSDVQITGVEGTTFSISGSIISMRNGQMVIWCYGAKHTWIGTLTYAGYTFASDTGNPLQFIIDQNRGYVYLGGKGSVTSPDGAVVHLP